MEGSIKLDDGAGDDATGLGVETGGGGDPAGDAGAGAGAGGGDTGGDGAGSDWRAALPEDLRDAGSIKDLKTVDDVVKKLVNAEAALGKNRISVPGEDATQEDWDQFYTMLGRPESADKYEVPAEGMPENLKLSDDFTAEFFQNAYEAGMNKTQVAKLLRWYANKQGAFLSQQSEARETAKNEAIETLKKDLGNAYDESLGLAQKAARQFGGDEFTQFLQETGMGNHPAFVKAFAKIGKALASDEILGEGSSRTFETTPAEAKARIQQLKGDPEFMKRYNHQDAKVRQQAISELEVLFQAANPEPAG